MALEIREKHPQRETVTGILLTKDIIPHGTLHVDLLCSNLGTSYEEVHT